MFNNNRESPSDNATNSITNGGEHLRDDDQQQISPVQKRPRNEFEDINTDDDANHLNVLTTLTSEGRAASLFSSDSRATIKKTSDQGVQGPR